MHGKVQQVDSTSVSPPALIPPFAGHLQVMRTSDNTTLDIMVVSPGGFSNSGAQDKFCQGTSCHIFRIYDQSAKVLRLLSSHKNLPPLIWF